MKIWVAPCHSFAPSIEDLAFALYGTALSPQVIEVDTNKVDVSQLDFVLPIYGYRGVYILPSLFFPLPTKEELLEGAKLAGLAWLKSNGYEPFLEQEERAYIRATFLV